MDELEVLDEKKITSFKRVIGSIIITALVETKTNVVVRITNGIVARIPETSASGATPQPNVPLGNFSREENGFLYINIPDSKVNAIDVCSVVPVFLEQIQTRVAGV